MTKRTKVHMQKIFEVKLGQKAEGLFTDSRERIADTLSSDLESVALVIEESNTKSNFIPQ